MMDGAILAGGKGLRMGRPKPFVGLGGRLLIEWVLDALQPLCREVFIVADQVEPFHRFGCRVVRDLIPDRGPMGGIYTALSSAHDRRVFVSGCDTPFLLPQIVRLLASQCEGYEVTVCRLEDGLHPLQAVYSRECLARMYDDLIADRLSLIDFIKNSKARVVTEHEIAAIDPQRISFFNINTPKDLESAEDLIHVHRGDLAKGGC